MPQDYSAIATAGVASLQTAIDNLNKLKRQPSADIPGIVAQIEKLQTQQAALRTLALKSFVADPANAAAINAVNQAAGKLKAEAGNITAVASAIDKAAKVVGYAADLAKALKVFAAA